MTDISNRISYSFIEYSAAFHMKYKHLFLSDVYDADQAGELPLIITWAETNMNVEEESGKCLVIATKTRYYPDDYQVSEEVFEDMLQAFLIFPEEDEDTHVLRQNFAQAILTK